MKNCPKTGLAVAGPFKRERGGRLLTPVTAAAADPVKARSRPLVAPSLAVVRHRRCRAPPRTA